jgi:hypothetical protein
MIKDQVEKTLDATRVRMLDEFKRLLTRPSLQLRPELQQVTELPEGARIFTHDSCEDQYGNGYKRDYIDFIPVEAYRVSYGSIVVYGSTPERAMEEFDHVFRNGEKRHG